MAAEHPNPEGRPDQDRQTVTLEPVNRAQPGPQYVDVAKVRPAQGAPVLPPGPTPHSSPSAQSTSASSRIDTLLHTAEGLVPTSPKSTYQHARPLPNVEAAPTPIKGSPHRGVSFGAAPRSGKKRKVVVQKAVHTLENTLEDLRALLRAIRYVLPLGGRVTRYVPDLFLTGFRSVPVVAVD